MGGAAPISGMASVAERLPNWWIAKVSNPGRFTKNFPEQHYAPFHVDSKGEPRYLLSGYVFVRAAGRSYAWMQPGFKSWLLVGRTRAEVTEAELAAFRYQIEYVEPRRTPLLDRVHQIDRQGRRILRRFSANQDFVADVS